ncbi:MAG: hypothetical protein Q9220_001485 [cf. Caloplaca sp. 1 TL-2023]
MVDHGNPRDVNNPITALAFVPIAGRLILLAGEGPYLSVFANEVTNGPLAARRVFDATNVHGISTTAAVNDNGDHFHVLIWGDRRARSGRLCVASADGAPSVEIHLGNEVTADDWILSASIRPTHTIAQQDGSAHNVHAVLVTAHDVALRFDTDAEDGSALEQIAAGPDSMLYSACIEWVEDDRVLVAAGTVFGEVLLWSFSAPASSVNDGSPAPSQLHYRFTGHEGSIFGVGISPLLSNLSDRDGQRLLASCSDDRTIRLWDVSDLRAACVVSDFEAGLQSPSSSPSVDTMSECSSDRCAGVVMGHVSRIWNVHFLVSASQVNLLSLGEDGTAQIWLVQQNSADGLSRLPKARLHASLQLSHRQTYSYHVGKNILASAVYQYQNGAFAVGTGGADGRVVSYDVYTGDALSIDDSSTTKRTMEDVAKHIEDPKARGTDTASPSDLTNQLPLCQMIFEALNGEWTLQREITSALPTYPSGTFIGKATFERRPPTASAFHREYLYVENGTFSTKQGFSFSATRRYVYRYEASSNILSAWFVKPDDNTTVDYLFHEIQPEKNDSSHRGKCLQDTAVVDASSYHLCIEDHYTPKYAFHLQDGNMHQWRLTYQVKGPHKNYVADASYSRKSPGSSENSADHTAEVVSALPKRKEAKRVSPDLQPIATDKFKSYVFVDQSSFLTMTAQGRVLLARVKTRRGEGDMARQDESSEPNIGWELLDQIDGLKSSSLMTKDISSGAVLLTGSDGTVYFYHPTRRRIRFCLKLPGKAALLHLQRVRNSKASSVRKDSESYFVLATCLGLSVASVYRLSNSDLDAPEPETKTPLLQLALPDLFITTGTFYIEEAGIWVLGSRGGAVACFITPECPSNSLLEPYSIVEDICGDEAVTTMQTLPKQDSGHSTLLWTTARDGHYAVHEISVNDEHCNVNFRTIHRAMPPFGPNVEGAAIEQKTHHLLLWGFRSKQFVVYNATKDIETMTVECGGAHRNWSYSPKHDGSDGGTFVWTKASVCYVHSQSRASHRILKSGGHGREIKAMAIFAPPRESPGVGNSYLATGAEDTTIRIWSYTDSGEPETGFRCLATLKKHTTGVQQLKWSDDGQLLFSAAGCEEFFVWRVQRAPFIGVGVVCETVFPTVTEDGDLRIMDFAVMRAAHDPNTNDIVETKEKIFVISLVYSDSSIRVGAPTFLIAYNSRILIHQSSIKSMAFIQIDPNHVLLVTDGDDGAVGITRIEYTGNSAERPLCSTLLIPKAHAAAVNAVASFPYPRNGQGEVASRVYMFASSGNDQKIKIWAVRLDGEHSGVQGMDVRLVDTRDTSVADVSALDVLRFSGTTVKVVVAGIGLESMDVDLSVIEA